MDRAAKQIIDRLGLGGLSRALDDLLDTSDLVHLANSCGIKYPGMRTQSQKRPQLVSDLVAKAQTHEVARKTILRALKKETVKASRDWSVLPGEDKARRLSDESFLLTDGNLGLHLYLLAGATEPGDLDGFGNLVAHQSLVRMAGNGAGPSATAAKSSREENRLKKRNNELEKKVRHLESQVTKSRESQRSFKRDLIQRKGELAESRMLTERLRRELADAQAAAKSASPSGGASDKAVSQLATSVRSLTSEQKKLVHRLEQLTTKLPKSQQASEKQLVATVLEALKDLRKETKKEADDQAKRLEQIGADVRSAGSAQAAQKPSRATKRSRPKGQAARVGVFVDVQNMYYSARQLKGKLDFDALLEAAVQDRRLIRATAYVVVSKETDQSQFIARLEKRGIEVRRKALQVRADGSMKGDWDMELAFDILDAAPKLDVVVLVSGDGDFTSLVKRVKTMGPRVEVIAFPRNTAKSLLQASDRFQPLDRKFMIYSRRSKSSKREVQPAKDAAPPPKTVKSSPPAKSAGASTGPASATTEKNDKAKART